MSRPSLVAFDFDGTLTDFIASDTEAIEQVRTSLGYAADPAVFLQASVDAIMDFHALVAQQLVDPLAMHRWRLTETCRRLQLALPTPHHVRLYQDTLVAATHPKPGAAELLKNIDGAGISIAIVTNAYDGPEQRRRIRRAFPQAHFAAVVVAGEGAHLKPHRQPFDELLRQLHIPAARTWYVGDLPGHDIPGALEAGIKPIIVSEHEPTRRLTTELGGQPLHNLYQVAQLLQLD